MNHILVFRSMGSLSFRKRFFQTKVLILKIRVSLETLVFICKLRNHKRINGANSSWKTKVLPKYSRSDEFLLNLDWNFVDLLFRWLTGIKTSTESSTMETVTLFLTRKWSTATLSLTNFSWPFAYDWNPLELRKTIFIVCKIRTFESLI